MRNSTPKTKDLPKRPQQEVIYSLPFFKEYSGHSILSRSFPISFALDRRGAIYIYWLPKYHPMQFSQHLAMVIIILWSGQRADQNERKGGEFPARRFFQIF
jgi:hypothetical protein